MWEVNDRLTAERFYGLSGPLVVRIKMANLLPVTEIELTVEEQSKLIGPIPIQLNCPRCHEPHIDEGDYAVTPHHTHACQGCGLTWRPSRFCTVGVKFIPGFKNEVKT